MDLLILLSENLTGWQPHFIPAQGRFGTNCISISKSINKLHRFHHSLYQSLQLCPKLAGAGGRWWCRAGPARWSRWRAWCRWQPASPPRPGSWCRWGILMGSPDSISILGAGGAAAEVRPWWRGADGATVLQRDGAGQRVTGVIRASIEL